MVIYLDNSSTTRQYDQVTAEMVRVMENDYGNPSSLHRMGLTAEKLVRKARRAVAESMGADEEEIVFTSGGTESDNTAILGAAYSRRRSGNKVITSKTEHPAVLESCKRLEREGYKVVYLDVDRYGLISLEQLKKEIDRTTILISIMHINNETGTRQPVEEIYRLKEEWNKAKGTDILLHVDAVQSYGKMDLKNLNAELISVSGHKVHGPKGIGALYIKKGITLDPILLGGGQEKGQRSGTENVPAIVGFGVAAEKINGNLAETSEKIRGLKETLADNLLQQVKDIKINGNPGKNSSPSILNVTFSKIRGEVLLHFLEQEGIYVSTGSACSSNKKGQSHVLEAMGLKGMEIEGAIRFSVSEFNSRAEIDFTVEKLVAIIAKMRKLSSFR